MTAKGKAKTGKRPNAARAREFVESTPVAREQLIDQLHRLYPDADCELDWNTPFELLIATILSAQSTDVRVNQVTPALFRRYPDAHALAAADGEELREEIRSTGFFNQKAKNIMGASARLVSEHDGEVPRDLEQLVELPGVARKTANVVLGTAYGIASGVVVDTHVKRLAYRLGLSAETEPPRVERDLMQALPRDQWIFLGHAIIWHGRRVCEARSPHCDECSLRPYCPRNGLA